VGLGQITKQFAQQAIANPMKDVIGALRPADAAAVADSLANQRQTVPAASDNVGAVVVGQVQAMQNALKEDQELVVLCTAGLETLRILEFFSPSPRVLVLTGLDTERTITRVIVPVESLQLVCKPIPVEAGPKAARVRFVVPKPKTE
jgi:hypothetical protein